MKSQKPPHGNVIARTDNYEINLSTDALTYQEREQLIIKKIDALPNFTWNEQKWKVRIERWEVRGGK